MTSAGMQAISPGLHLEANWRMLRGMAYGLRHSVMLGDVRVIMPAAFDIAEFDEDMAQALGAEALPSALSTGAEGIVERLFHWHLTVQQQQRIPVFAPCRMLSSGPAYGAEGTVFSVAVPYFARKATIASLNWIRSLIHLTLSRGISWASDAEKIRQSIEQLRLELNKHAPRGINNFHLMNAARLLDVPARYIFADTFTVGYGRSMRWLQSTVTDNTSVLGTHIAHSKMRTVHVLAQHGLPTPRHQAAKTVEEALSTAKALGFPVVVKPDDQEQGCGVSAGLRGDEAVSTAYRAAAKHSKTIIVEKHIEGQDYRLTVFRGRVLKILHRRAGGVVGDGVHTIGELVQLLHQTARYQRYYRVNRRHMMELDGEASRLLTDRGLTAGSVPPQGEFVALRSQCNISAGGIQSLVPLAEAHPANLAMAVRAAEAICLDLAGVDLIIPDIAQSWLETGAAILEINAKPQIGIEYAPEVYQTIVRELVDGKPRIPIHLVICVSDAEDPGMAGVEKSVGDGEGNGVSTGAGVWLNGEQIAGPTESRFDAAQILLNNRLTSAATCYLTASEIVAKGSPADRYTALSVLGLERATAEQRTCLDKALGMVQAHVAPCAPGS